MEAKIKIKLSGPEAKRMLGMPGSAERGGYMPGREVTNNPPKLGSGERFQKLKSALAKKKGISNPGALAATIGRKKYGSKKMAAMSAAGRKH